MFRRFEAKNFRGFSDVKVDGLRRFNLVTGANGSGKTAFLEGLFLNAGATNASLPLKLASWRGDEVLHSEMDVQFRSLFYGFEPWQEASIVCYADSRDTVANSPHERRLTLTPISDTQPVLFQDSPEPSSDLGKRLLGLELQFKGPESEGEAYIRWEIDSSSETKEPTLRQHVERVSDHLTANFIASTVPKHSFRQQMSDEVSRLIQDRRKNDLLDLLRTLDKRIEDIFPLTEQGKPTIYVDVGLQKLLPFTLLGGGFAHLLRIACDALALRGGILLLDEVENGIHHSVVPRMLDFLLRVSEQQDLQIFATTHSAEVIAQLQTCVSEKDFDDTSIIRFMRKGNEISSVTYAAEDLDLAKEMDLEVR